MTSSASMPAVVAQMLNTVQVEPGMRVLEIVTGDGAEGWAATSPAG